MLYWWSSQCCKRLMQSIMSVCLSAAASCAFCELTVTCTSQYTHIQTLSHNHRHHHLTADILMNHNHHMCHDVQIWIILSTSHFIDWYMSFIISLISQLISICLYELENHLASMIHSLTVLHHSCTECSSVFQVNQFILINILHKKIGIDENNQISLLYKYNKHKSS